MRTFRVPVFFCVPGESPEKAREFVFSLVEQLMQVVDLDPESDNEHIDAVQLGNVEEVEIVNTDDGLQQIIDKVDPNAEPPTPQEPEHDGINCGCKSFDDCPGR